MHDRYTGTFIVTSIPEGEAPQVVRRAWVGCTLPCLPILGVPEEGITSLLNKNVERKELGFVVPQSRALRILGDKAPKAARWFRQHGFPNRQNFFFRASEGTVIDGVRIQKMIVYDNLETGRWEPPDAR